MNERPETKTYYLRTGRDGVPALGRVMGRADMRTFSQTFPATSDEEQIVLMDYGDTPDCNSSYVERTYFWARDAGRAFIGEDPRTFVYLPDSEDAVIAAPVFPIAIRCTPNVTEEFVAAARKVRGLAMVAPDATEPYRVRLIGDLDRSLREALDPLCNSPGLTASELHELTERRGISGARDVGVNVWHNRLAALHRLRLVWRFKEGRFWKYSALASEVTYG